MAPQWPVGLVYIPLADMQNIYDLNPQLEETKKIAVICHPMPDGDAFGSMLGLARVLESVGHQVSRISPTSWGDFLAWMPDVDKILDFSKNKKSAGGALQNADIIYCLDFNAPPRLGVLANTIFGKKNKAIKVLIDHHLNPAEESFDFGISKPEMSSTSEMVYDYILDMGWDPHMDEQSRICIFTGIVTDTGSFRFPSTTAATFEKVAQLKKMGMDHSDIFVQLFDQNSPERMKFIGYLLEQKLKLDIEHGFGYIAVSKAEMAAYQVSVYDLEGIVNMVLSIRGIYTAAMISERGDEVKLSLRSVGDRDVSVIMREHFAGGGHKNAAGGKSDLNLTETTEKLTSILSK